VPSGRDPVKVELDYLVSDAGGDPRPRPPAPVDLLTFEFRDGYVCIDKVEDVSEFRVGAMKVVRVGQDRSHYLNRLSWIVSATCIAALVGIAEVHGTVLLFGRLGRPFGDSDVA
jgi:hypothetical protein